MVDIDRRYKCKKEKNSCKTIRNAEKLNMTTLVLDIKEKSNMQRIFFHLLHLKFGKIALMHMVYRYFQIYS